MKYITYLCCHELSLIHKHMSVILSESYCYWHGFPQYGRSITRYLHVAQWHISYLTHINFVFISDHTLKWKVIPSMYTSLSQYVACCNRHKEIPTGVSYRSNRPMYIHHMYIHHHFEMGISLRVLRGEMLTTLLKATSMVDLVKTNQET